VSKVVRYHTLLSHTTPSYYLTHLGGVAVVALKGGVEARRTRKALDGDRRHVGARDPPRFDVALVGVEVRERVGGKVRVWVRWAR